MQSSPRRSRSRIATRRALAFAGAGDPGSRRRQRFADAGRAASSFPDAVVVAVDLSRERGSLQFFDEAPPGRRPRAAPSARWPTRRGWREGVPRDDPGAHDFLWSGPSRSWPASPFCVRGCRPGGRGEGWPEELRLRLRAIRDLSFASPASRPDGTRGARGDRKKLRARRCKLTGEAGTEKEARRARCTAFRAGDRAVLDRAGRTGARAGREPASGYALRGRHRSARPCPRQRDLG